jgi:hypothetical protein
MSEPSFPKDCKACKGASDLFEAFSKGSFSRALRDQDKQDQAHHATKPAANETPGPDHRPSEALMPCPPNTSEIGHATWLYLHTTAAYYPDQPTTSQQSLMRSMMEGLAEFYPCSFCREHLKVQLKSSPPRVESAVDLSAWLCKIHNEARCYPGHATLACLGISWSRSALD